MPVLNGLIIRYLCIDDCERIMIIITNPHSPNSIKVKDECIYQLSVSVTAVVAGGSASDSLSEEDSSCSTTHGLTANIGSNWKPWTVGAAAHSSASSHSSSEDMLPQIKYYYKVMHITCNWFKINVHSLL